MTDAWPPPPSSPPPVPPPTGRGRIVAGAIVGVAIVLVVAIVAALALSEDDNSLADPGGPRSTQDPTVPAPTDPSTPGQTTVPSSDIEAAIDEAIAFIENERQRSFTTRPTVEALDDAAFVARYDGLIDEAIAEDPQDIENSTTIYRAFGFIDPDEDVITVERSFGAAGVLGFYDPEKNELVVRGGSVTPFFRTVLVHELTHALDDQLVELDRPDYDEADDEVSYGLSAVAEGNARRVEHAFYDTLSRDDQRKADNEEAGYGANLDFDSFNTSYLLLQLAPYDLGEEFVGELLDTGGEDAVDAALRDPPHTSEQVIDFDAYEAKEPRVEVTPPAADGAIVEDGVVGQVAIAAILSDAMSVDDATKAADGWGGDWFVSWKAGNASCIRAAFVMETDADHEQLYAAWQDWVDSRDGGASVTQDADRITLTSCVA